MYIRFALACLAGSVFVASASVDGQTPQGAVPPAAAPGALGADARTLYLRAGSIDTRQLPSLLAPGAEFNPAQHYVMQLDGPMTPARHEALTAAGVVLGEYLPMNAYVVRLGGVRAEALSKLSFVAWVGRFEAAWKLAPEIGARQFVTEERRQLDAACKKRLVAALFEDADAAAAKSSLESHGAVAQPGPVARGKRFLEVDAKTADIEGLRGIDQVMFVEEATEGGPRNATTTWICQSDVTNYTPLWDAGLHGEGQMGGLIDWQMRETHCCFSDPNGNPIGPTHRKIQAYYGLGQQSPYAYHGTHVAGTFLGEDLNQTDLNLRGMAYEARVVFQHYNAVITPTSLNDRLQIAHGDGARVHSNSWGSTDRQYIAWARDIDVFTRNNDEDLVLVAVANENAPVECPENAKNCLAVAATQDTPNENTRCYGAYGPTLDGRQKPEVWAPGCGSISAGTTPCNTASGGGTSYACPAVAGFGLLVRQYFTDGFYPSGAANPTDAFTPSGALLKAVLINSAVHMTGFSGFYTPHEGWGRILVDDALYFSRTPPDPRRLVVRDVWNAAGLSTGQSQTTLIAVRQSTQKLKVTLVWTDAPAALLASFTPINNLDLQVTDPQGTVYQGNVFTGEESTPGGGTADLVNNTEQVHRLAPAIGRWQITVLGTAVNQDLQGYALAITGDVLDGDPPGDLDGDFIINVNDYAIFLAAFGASIGDPRYNPAADFDGDGVVSLVDYQTWLSDYRAYLDDKNAPPPPLGPLGDMTGDGVVDGRDIQGFVDTLLDPSSASPRDRYLADMNGDGQWDMTDVALFVAALVP